MTDTEAAVSRQVWDRGQWQADTDAVVVESAVAMVYNGVSHAVMMTTPADLEDFALGFSLSEGIVDNPGQVLGVDVIERSEGLELAIEITGAAFAALKQRRRSLAGRSGCGLCGVESLEQAIPAVARVSGGFVLAPEALQHALAELGGAQVIRARSAGVHAAAWCDSAGRIRLLREDVGRHNALDKLLGAMTRAGEGGAGFVLVSSRLSYEMVAKAARLDIAVLAAVSAPTSLALQLAAQADMSLVGFLQPGRQAIYTGEGRFLHGSAQEACSGLAGVEGGRA
ncbi:formate dehydrogenase accessory sulfurtransferase FdhD [Mangrovimicrobium sediminis]|uniref:Sulfur carrier protein FdhD n=1 Tax=Mangrovimicrobium sediminis TaxID=2562682 RepID=A0A4Z0M9H0_9GAMM|nr:formate dehydrogenase accessory sulfurtransferase FdhD [Haliea sp. SAOS-164]TGD76036.1 formate dehydrogenase accessory sulfurtransferase FdhD [Haliea sp. SAOS-164]